MDEPALTRARIQSALTTTLVGHPLYYWPQIGSTMDEARRLAERAAPEGIPDGLVVLADEQTAGRGRLQRRWWAPPGSSLLLSLVLCPPLHARQAQRLTMICSLAVCDAIVAVSGLDAQVKWPNDVLLAGKKVCGILTELDLQGEQIRYAIIGMGLNVNVDFKAAPPLMAPATSVMTETGCPIPRLELLAALLASIERRYLALREGHSFHREWAERLATLGHQVQASGEHERWSGLAEGVDEDGALLLRLDDGRLQRVLAGDVTLRE
jgi:BirA family biotin operon repressor/biotin-[acetyl-CoA-carboxylase] ligase